MSTNTQRIFVFEDKRYLIVDMHFEYVQRAESYSGRPSTRPLHSNILLYLRPLGKYKEQALIMQYALKRDISGHIEFLITDNGLENKIMSDLEFANAKIKRIGISSQHPGFEGQDILRVEIKPYIVKFQDEITELPTNPSNPFIASNIPITTPDKEEAPALVTAVSGPKTLTIGQQAQFTVTEWNGQTQKADLQRIRWAIQVDGEVQRIKPQGKILKYTPDQSIQGKEILVMPYLKQYTPKVSVKATVANNMEKEEYRGFYFEKDKSYPIKVSATTYIGLSLGPVGTSYDNLEISYMGETIESTGFSIGAGLGTEVLTRIDSEEIMFHDNVNGKSLLDVFNKTGLTTIQKAGGMISIGKIQGFDSPERMNLIWSAKLFGAGLKAGISADRSTAPFKNKR